jgi:predicted transcriptional regulator
MPITLDELDRFHRFARDRIARGDAESTLADCLRDFLDQRDREETIADVQRGLADLAAGRWSSLDEVAERLRRELDSQQTGT